MERYEEKLAAAFVRGTAGRNPALLAPSLVESPLEESSAEEMQTIFRAGKTAEA